MDSLPSCFSRLITCSGQVSTHTPQAVQHRGSKKRPSGPVPSRCVLRAPVGQTLTQAPQREQPVLSTVTVPSGHPGPPARQGGQSGSRAPRLLSASTVASGSARQMAAFRGRPAVSSGPVAPVVLSKPPTGRPSAPASSSTKALRLAPRSVHSFSPQPTRRTPTPLLKNWRSQPALTISKDGTFKDNQPSPRRGPAAASWQVTATPFAGVSRSIDSTRTPAAAPRAPRSAPARLRAPRWQASTHAPQAVQRSPSTTSRPPSWRSAPCLQDSRQTVQDTDRPHLSSRKVAIGRRARPTPRNSDRRDIPPTEKLTRSLEGVSRSAAATRAAAAPSRASLSTRAASRLHSRPARRSTMSAPAAGTPALRNEARRSPRALAPARHPSTTRCGWASPSTSVSAFSDSQTRAATETLAPGNFEPSASASSETARGAGSSPRSAQMTTKGPCALPSG